MAVFAYTDGFVLINAINFSTWTKSVSLDVDVDDLDTTAMGAGGWRSRIGGLRTGTLALTLLNDFAAATVDDRLWPLLGTVVSFEVRPTTAARSATNPALTGSILVAEYSFGGSVGDVAEFSASFPTTGAVVRATS